MTTNIVRAREWVNEPLERFLIGEIRNERNGGVVPATLSSAIDSYSQCPSAFGLGEDELAALLVIRDLLPGNTPVAVLI